MWLIRCHDVFRVAPQSSRRKRHRINARPRNIRARLPIVTAISINPALQRIGWREADAHVGADVLARGEHLARVVEQHRSGYRVDNGATVHPVQSPAAMIRSGVDPMSRPAVGDWVALIDGKPPMISRLLPRRSALVRAAAGERHQKQIIAANVDVVFVVCGLDDDYNPRRIERYLLLVDGSGALPVIVLTKADKCADADARRLEIQALAPGAVVLALNAKSPDTALLLEPWLRTGSTAVLVGSSGAGKSTLTNTLLGIDKQKTKEVRGHDSRGRHTTTHRALIALPSGGCLIDTPGMRELKMTGDENLDAGQFDDVTELAGHCRFRDCRHAAEPGCSVRAALESGTLDAQRWASYVKLRGELGGARVSVEEQRRRKAGDKSATRAFGKRLTDKYGSR